MVRAHLDPDEFVAWCAGHGMNVDAKARTRWASEVAYRELSGKG